MNNVTLKYLFIDFEKSEQIFGRQKMNPIAVPSYLIILIFIWMTVDDIALADSRLITINSENVRDPLLVGSNYLVYFNRGNLYFEDLSEGNQTLLGSYRYFLEHDVLGDLSVLYQDASGIKINTENGEVPIAFDASDFRLEVNKKFLRTNRNYKITYNQLLLNVWDMRLLYRLDTHDYSVIDRKFGLSTYNTCGYSNVSKKYVLSGRGGSCIWVYDFSNYGSIDVGLLSGDRGFVSSCSISHDGSILLYWPRFRSEPSSLVLIDLQTGKKKKIIPGSNWHGAESIQLSTDGKKAIIVDSGRHHWYLLDFESSAVNMLDLATVRGNIGFTGDLKTVVYDFYRNVKVQPMIEVVGDVDTSWKMEDVSETVKIETVGRYYIEDPLTGQIRSDISEDLSAIRRKFGRDEALISDVSETCY